MTEKRVNCSINTWIRGPGITMVVSLALFTRCAPHPDVAEEDLMPWYVVVPVTMVTMFNGQYYAQRVIGNYYIRKAQANFRRGEERVELHCS
jgi:hypothetical protein